VRLGIARKLTISVAQLSGMRSVEKSLDLSDKNATLHFHFPTNMRLKIADSSVIGSNLEFQSYLLLINRDKKRARGGI
jgi:hypothetical protein